MAERLMALVLKVQHEPKKLDKLKISPMHDIGFFVVLDVLLMAEMSEKAAIRFAKNRMAGNMVKANSDGSLFFTLKSMHTPYLTSSCRTKAASL